jgi:isochorismate pyruvate lyase
MKRPDECSNLTEVRAEIDRLDRKVIALLGQRFAYVKAAAKFKTSEESVRAAERFKALLEQRRAWAAEEGLNPDAIEELYRNLVNHFIAAELQQWRAETASDEGA